MKVSSKERLLKKVIKKNDCWVWTGCKSKAKKAEYGHIWHSKLKRSVGAHRLSYEIFKGKLIKNMTIDHTCRNTLCVNPDHLRQISLRENILAGTCPSAINAKKTHCPKGHEYKGYNIKLTKKGRRICRICFNNYLKRYRLRIKKLEAEI